MSSKKPIATVGCCVASNKDALVVEVSVRSRLLPRNDIEYLVAINYDPYQKYKGADRQSVFVEDPDTAFRFKSIAAAEMAAVMVGGRPVFLSEAVEAYKQRD